MDNDELMNRRQFFKKAAKGLLPMLGAVLRTKEAAEPFEEAKKELDDAVGKV